jgi:hypothetical protein
MTHPYPDIFDVLDEELLRDSFPKFPGHAEAHEEWKRNRKAHPNRKSFYEERFGIPRNLEVYATIADRMHSAGRVPAVLDDLMLALERYALGGSE